MNSPSLNLVRARKNRTTGFDLIYFLERYGYLEYARANVGDGSSEEEIVEFAIKAYQQRYRIQATGKLDEETKSHMKRPRCGNPDFVNGVAPFQSDYFDSQPYLQSYIECAWSHLGDGASILQILRSAVENYQQNHGIEATGELDDATKSHMKMNNPRSDGVSNRPNLLQPRGFHGRRALTLISNMGCRLSLASTIMNRAYEIHRRLEDQRCTRGRNPEALVAAYIYVACQQEGRGRPLTVEEICSVVDGATEEEISQAIGFVVEQLKFEAGPLYNLRVFCSDLGMSSEEVKAVEETFQKAGDLDIRDIRTKPLFVGAAIIFMVTQLSDSKKPLRDISGVTALAECTIKNAYRDLYPHADKIIPQWYARNVT